MLIDRSNDEIIKSTKNLLNLRFNIKDLRTVDVILVIKITKTIKEIILRKSHYTDKIYEKINKDNKRNICF